MGIRAYPPDEVAARHADNWRRFRRMGKALFWLVLLPFLIALWAAGYGQGYLDGQAATVARTTEKDSK